MLIDVALGAVGHSGSGRQGERDVLDAVQMPGRHQVHVDRTRDTLLTDFGRATLSDRYLMPGEEFQDLYHFTVGGAIEDHRLLTLPPYAHLRRNA